MPGTALFLSSTSPGPRERRAAAAVALAAVVFAAALAPFARVPLAPMPAFLPAYQSALVVCDVITTVLLLGVFAMTRSRALLVLAAGYLFGAIMAVAHALSFPGLFAPGGWLQAGPQSTAWLYFLWHAGFPLYVAAYALLDTREAPLPDAPVPRSLIASGLALAIVPPLALVALATAGHDLLPPIMSGDRDAPLKITVAVATWMLGFAALVLLWRKRPQTVLDTWLMVVLCAWLADSALAALLNNARYDVGWYAGRVCGLAASALVLVVLLVENGALHARLAVAHRELARSGRALGEANSQLEVANRDLQRFVGAVAHDLQQPILSISGHAQRVQRDARGSLRPADDAGLTRIVAIAEHADGMIQGLLQFARLGQRELDLEAVDLNRVVDDACTALAREIEAGGVELRVAPLPQVRGDAALLGLAFVNLLSNAVKYSRGSRPPVVVVDTHEGRHGRVVTVRDNGVGFDMAYASRLFTPFERLHGAKEFEGTGMGLANVRRIMERHGGSVHVEAAPGAGATFFLVFPG